MSSEGEKLLAIRTIGCSAGFPGIDAELPQLAAMSRGNPHGLLRLARSPNLPRLIFTLKSPELGLIDQICFLYRPAPFKCLGCRVEVGRYVPYAPQRTGHQTHHE